MTKNTTQECYLTGKEATAILACSHKSLVPNHKERMISLQATLMNPNIKCYLDSVSPYRNIYKLDLCLEYQ